MKFMSRCLMPDTCPNPGPPIADRMDGVGPDSVDVEYFLRRPRAIAERRGGEASGLPRAPRLQRLRGQGPAAVSPSR